MFEDFIQEYISVPEQVAVKLTYLRDSVKSSVTMPFSVSQDRFVPTRGMHFLPKSDIRYAASLSDSFDLGVREIRDGIANVFFTLRTIRKNFKNIGGPISIARIATMEASEGWPRLLIFLTMLSANLAIINFLPIPVLDGGHMMFLLWEGVTGKPLNDRAMLFLTMLGFGFVMSLMVIVLGMDIYRLIPSAS